MSLFVFYRFSCCSGCLSMSEIGWTAELAAVSQILSRRYICVLSSSQPRPSWHWTWAAFHIGCHGSAVFPPSQPLVGVPSPTAQHSTIWSDLLTTLGSFRLRLSIIWSSGLLGRSIAWPFYSLRPPHHKLLARPHSDLLIALGDTSPLRPPY